MGLECLVGGAEIFPQTGDFQLHFRHAPISGPHVFLLGSSKHFKFMTADKQRKFLKRLSPDELDSLSKVSIVLFFSTPRTVFHT